MSDFKPVVGLVVPTTTLTATWGEATHNGEPLPTSDERTVETDGKTYTLKRNGPSKGKPPNRAPASLELSIAIQALQNAQRGADALRADMPRHERARILIDPISQLEHAKRAIDEQLEKWGAGHRYGGEEAE